jgi:hypothetical protein
MKRHLGLYHVQRSHDVAHAQFALFQEFYDSQSRFIGKGFEYRYQFVHVSPFNQSKIG